VSSPGLSIEQEFWLRTVEANAHRMGHDELVHALVHACQAALLMKEKLLEQARDGGLYLSYVHATCVRPRTKAELKSVFGFVPEAERAEAHIRHLDESVRMDLDIDAIVQDTDDE
jgi:hypothetical protein